MHGPVEKRSTRSPAVRPVKGQTKQAAGVVRIPVALDERLTRLALKTGRSKSYYARKDYQNAMTAFAEGYKTYKASPKGPDNLLKFGITLAVMGRKADACQVFAKFSQDYPRATDLQKRRVDQERQKNGCG